MKKKKTDKLIKKAQKRYTKLQLFLKKIIPCTAVVFFVYCIITSITIRSWRNERNIFYDYLLSSSVDDISVFQGTDNIEYTDNFILDKLCSLTDHWISSKKEPEFIAIYDTDTGQILYTTDKNVFIHFYSGQKQRDCRCADEAIDKVISSLKKYYGDDIYFIVKTAYIKDDIFIPASVDVSKSNDSGFEIIQNIKFDGFNTEDYTYYKFATDVIMNVYGRSLDNDTKKIMEKEVTEAFNHPETRYIISNADMNHNIIRSRRLLNLYNKNCEIIYYSKYNFLYKNEKYYITQICIALAISVFISWILGLKKYSELSSHYALEDYRRDITNTLAHDLKSPLTVISGCAENIKCDTNPQKNEHYSDSILENVSYMDSIISNVLELSKLESSAVNIKKISINIKELIDEIIKKYQTVISEKFLTIKINGNGTIRADRNMISHAFENLLTNAIKYSELSGQISIEISDNEYTIKNQCSDLLQLNTDDLCKPFIKGDESRSGKNGSGLGLSIVKNITDAHGYKLSLNYEKGQFTAKIVF